MNGGGATPMFIIGVAYGQLLSGVAGGSGGGGDEPWHPSPVHASAPAAPGPYSCPVCGRRFQTEKAVHGHMRCHPDRSWRGMEEPPRIDPAEEKKYRYTCEHCGTQFETRQALGGHRASHSGKMGCFGLSRSRQQQCPQPDGEPVVSRRPAVLPFDLNDPPLPEDEEDP